MEQRDTFTTTHAEFVRGYRSGKIDLTFDAPSGYRLAASEGRGFVWTLTGCGHTILGPVAIALLLVVLTFILRAMLGFFWEYPQHSWELLQARQVVFLRCASLFDKVTVTYGST